MLLISQHYPFDGDWNIESVKKDVRYDGFYISDRFGCLSSLTLLQWVNSGNENTIMRAMNVVL